MVIVIAQYTMVSWCPGNRSQSRTVRRQRVIHARVRSMTQRRGSTWKVCRLSGRLTIWSVSLGLSAVPAQVTSLPA
jgi:hypothetical protein